MTRSQSGRVVDEAVDGVDARPGAANFVYDGAGRLTGAWVPGRALAYTFAPSGGCGSSPAAGRNTNRTSTTDNATTTSACYDGADRLVSTTDPRYPGVAYDAHGNTTTLGPQALRYDGADRHVQTAVGTNTLRYVRDATDRIVERRLNGATTSRYGYSGDGDTPDFVMDGANTVIEDGPRESTGTTSPLPPHPPRGSVARSGRTGHTES